MKSCSSCGAADLVPAAQFCPMCGARLAAPASPVQPKAAAAPPPRSAAASPKEAPAPERPAAQATGAVRARVAKRPAPSPSGQARKGRLDRNTEIIPREEIEARLKEIRGRIAGKQAEPAQAAPREAPKGGGARSGSEGERKRPFSETLWFMQAADPDQIIVDSDSDIDPNELKARYRKEDTLDTQVRKEFSLSDDVKK